MKAKQHIVIMILHGIVDNLLLGFQVVVRSGRSGVLNGRVSRFDLFQPVVINTVVIDPIAPICLHIDRTTP